MASKDAYGSLVLGVSSSGSWGMLGSNHQASASQLGSNLPLGGANGELNDRMQPSRVP